MISWLIAALAIAFAFGIVIFVHEFGHFIVAKKSGVKVERFSFGLGPELIGFQMGETRYCIAWLPLGGEVRMAGEFPGGETAPVDADAAPRDTSRDFFSQPWYRRVAIAFAGPLMNYVLAVLLFFGIFLIWGEPVQSNKTEIGQVVAGMPAEQAGLKPGDRILKIQGEAVDEFPIIAQKIEANAGKSTELLIQRGDQQLTIAVTPDAEKKKIGIAPATPQVERQKVGVFKSVKMAFVQCWHISAGTVSYLAQKIYKKEKPDMAGPIGIGQVIVKAVKSGAEDFFFLIGLLSVAIGLFNLFPIPLLDGGHVLYYVIEGIRGRPISQNVMAKANMVGLAFLLSLLVFATMNDFQRFRNEPTAPTAATESVPAK